MLFITIRDIHRGIEEVLTIVLIQQGIVNGKRNLNKESVKVNPIMIEFKTLEIGLKHGYIHFSQ